MRYVKKRYLTMVVLLMGAHVVANGQYVVKPYTLASIYTVQPFKLPSIIKPVGRGTTQGAVRPGTNGVCTGSCSSVLPVTLLQLAGNRKNNYQVLLNWKTQNEINSKGFDVERSVDGGVTFLVVGSVASDTTKSTEKNYALTNLNSYAYITYYRVKQLDIDGTFTYSNTIAVGGYDLQQKATLSPNPATDQCVLSCFAGSAGKGTVTITLANGQQLAQIPFMLSAGGNTLPISLTKYVAGFYYVQLIWPDGSQSMMKLVVR